MKEVILGEYGEIMPLAIGGGSTTYLCDRFETNVPESGSSERGVLFGGNAIDGSSAGFVYSSTNITATNALAYFGSRLCFIPAA